MNKFLKTKKISTEALAKVCYQLKTEKKGFTLIEMMVVIGIFGVLTAIVVFNYGDFNANILVTNTAHEIAVTAREAQVFGLGSRGFTDSSEVKKFQYPYGVFFSLNTDTTKRRVISFRDLDELGTNGYGQCNDAPNGVGTCDCAGELTDECFQSLIFQNNIRITELRLGVTGQEVDTCLYEDPNDPTKEIAVSFKRPNPEAYIVDQIGGGSGYAFAQIKVEAKRGNAKPAYVLIRDTGQISVSQDDVCITYN
jgi:prepilin-type N-terminal cleavage/methylation domain-containing protein